MRGEWLKVCIVWLYVVVGVLCNICEVDFNRYGYIVWMNFDGLGYEVVVCGICNLVGFDWDFLIKYFWFIDNGWDYLGDD